jgi:hypothetical protein
VDGRATARHLHGKIKRAARCLTVTVPAESAAQSRDNCSLNSDDRRLLCPTRTTMVLMLVHLQGAAAIFRVGRHNHHGPLCEGRGLTHALTDTPPTDLTVATHSPLGAQPRSDRILRLPCGRLRPAAPYMHMHIALPTTLHVHVRARCPQARVPQLQPVGKQERSKCASAEAETDAVQRGNGGGAKAADASSFRAYSLVPRLRRTERPR